MFHTSWNKVFLHGYIIAKYLISAWRRELKSNWCWAGYSKQRVAFLCENFKSLVTVQNRFMTRVYPVVIRLRRRAATCRGT